MSGRLKFALVMMSALLAGSLALTACSSGNDNKSPTAAPTSRPAATTAPAANPTTAPAANPTAAGGGAANNITIADFSYSPARFNARAGQAVQLTVTNSGQLPHTFTITGVVDSGTISAGQSKTVTFTPATAGQLVYFCTIHGQAAMSGQITVAGTSGSLPPEPPAGGQTTSGAAGGATPAAAPSGYEYGY